MSGSASPGCQRPADCLNCLASGRGPAYTWDSRAAVSTQGPAQGHPRGRTRGHGHPSQTNQTQSRFEGAGPGDDVTPALRRRPGRAPRPRVEHHVLTLSCPAPTRGVEEGRGWPGPANGSQDQWCHAAAAQLSQLALAAAAAAAVALIR